MQTPGRIDRTLAIDLASQACSMRQAPHEAGGTTGHQRLQPVAEVAKEDTAFWNAIMRCPSEARANLQQGTAKIAFNIDRQQRILPTRLVASCGSAALNEEALSLTQRSHFPSQPVFYFASGEISKTVPIRFSL
jgi:TonB family protein